MAAILLVFGFLAAMCVVLFVLYKMGKIDTAPAKVVDAGAAPAVVTTTPAAAEVGMSPYYFAVILVVGCFASFLAVNYFWPAKVKLAVAKVKITSANSTMRMIEKLLRIYQETKPISDRHKEALDNAIEHLTKEAGNISRYRNELAEKHGLEHMLPARL